MTDAERDALITERDLEQALNDYRAWKSMDRVPLDGTAAAVLSAVFVLAEAYSRDQRLTYLALKQECARLAGVERKTLDKAHAIACRHGKEQSAMLLEAQMKQWPNAIMAHDEGHAVAHNIAREIDSLRAALSPDTPTPDAKENPDDPR